MYFRLKEWMSKESEREKEKNDRRQERLERQLNPAQHKFDDPQYFEQRAKVQEDLEAALATGMLISSHLTRLCIFFLCLCVQIFFG